MERTRTSSRCLGYNPGFADWQGFNFVFKNLLNIFFLVHSFELDQLMEVLLVFGLQNMTATCSWAYWALNFLQVKLKHITRFTIPS